MLRAPVPAPQLADLRSRRGVHNDTAASLTALLTTFAQAARHNLLLHTDQQHLKQQPIRAPIYILYTEVYAETLVFTVSAAN